jgi:hypothetical protein
MLIFSVLSDTGFVSSYSLSNVFSDLSKATLHFLSTGPEFGTVRQLF